MTRSSDVGTEPEGGPVTRSGVRVELPGDAVIRRAGQGSYRVRLLDISLQGCKAEFVDRPRLGERVWIKFGAFQSLEAVVCWTRDNEVGMEFARPLHPAIFDVLVYKRNA